MARHNTPFDDLNDARIHAGLLVKEAIELLGIKRRTWYRWKSVGYGPKWALKVLEILSGDLSYFGWKTMYLKRGVLYSYDLNPKYYNWEAADLLITAFCRCSAHAMLRENRRAATEREASVYHRRGANVALTQRLRGPRGPALHLPASSAAIAEGDQ